MNIPKIECATMNRVTDPSEARWLSHEISLIYSFSISVSPQIPPNEGI